MRVSEKKHYVSWTVAHINTNTAVFV